MHLPTCPLTAGIEDTVLTVNSGRLPTGVPFPYFTPAANNVVLCFNHKMGAKRHEGSPVFNALTL